MDATSKPQQYHKFHGGWGGQVIHRIGNAWDTLGGCRGDRQTNEQMDRQMDSAIALAVWLSGNALASINVGALHQARLVPGWVTICGRLNHFFL